MELVRADDIHKRYVMGKTVVQVLSGASLAVQAGETVAIVGRSGAGKSTLMHILGGLDAPDEGGVFFKGRSLYVEHSRRDAAGRAGRLGLRIAAARFRTRLRAGNIGFVFQAYHLLPELSVLENTILPAMASLVLPPPDIQRRGMDLLASVGLAERAEHKPLELSGGEQQRLAVARALMNNPELVLADEPTGNLDDSTGQQVLDLLFDLSGRQNRALVMVTHNENIARQCSRVLLLADGRLAAR